MFVEMIWFVQKIVTARATKKKIEEIVDTISMKDIIVRSQKFDCVMKSSNISLS